jgi:hypothetical protein
MAVVALQATHTHTIKYATTKRKSAHKYEYEHAPRQRRDQHDDEEEGHHCGLRVKPGQHPPPNSPPQAPPTPQPQCSTHTTLHHVPLRRENGAAHNAVQGGAPRGGAHTAPRRSEPADRFVGATLQQALSRANIRY